jgi:hypothetical protein
LIGKDSGSTIGFQLMVREQLAANAIAIRRAAIAGVLLSVALMAVAAFVQLTLSASADVEPNLLAAPNVMHVIRQLSVRVLTIPSFFIGLLAPMGFWRGQEPSSRSYAWSLPIRRSQHVFSKALSGWTIIIGFVLAVIVWYAVATRGLVFERLSFDGQLWFWAIPFVAGSLGYVLGTIAVIETDQPWICLLSVLFLLFAYVGVTELNHLEPVIVLERSFLTIVEGRYGMWTLISGYQGWQNPTAATADSGTWGAAALLWIAPALIVLLLAAHHHQER